MTRALRATVAALLAGLALFTATGTAAAHAVLVATDPAKGARLSHGPDRVSATFNEQLQPQFPAMTVVGPDHHLWSTGDTVVHGAVADVALRPLGPVGTYTVYYRVTSADGHVVSGSWQFELTTPGTGTPGPEVGKPTEEPDQPRRSADPDADGALPVWPFVAGAVAIVAAGLWVARPKS